jgi:hypothetical protein
MDFLNKENVDLIWEVILDAQVFDINKHKQNIQDTHDLFIEQIRLFNQREKKNPSSQTQTLIDMNKNFITSFLEKISQPRNNSKSESVVTSQDIQNERKIAFENELSKKRTEFDHAMNVTVPEPPNFKDNLTDQPIGGNMEMLIAQTLAQRNLELEKIHIENKNGIKPEQLKQFLNSQETSIKNEKHIQANSTNSFTGGREIKYIQIGETVDEPLDNTIVDLNHPPEKHISWAKENHVYEFKKNVDYDNNNDNDVNIFSKLKKVDVSGSKTTEEEILELKEKIYRIETTLAMVLKKIETM